MTHVAKEIASQPECWRRALDMPGAGLPRPGERVAVIGCGTSWYMAQAYAAARELAGRGETDAFPASEFPRRPYDRILAISRSGTTSEVLAVLGESRGIPATAITADPGTPIVDAADEVIVLDFADERSLVQTRFATTVLALLRGHLGAAPADLPAQAERALIADLPDLDHRNHAFLGTGWTVGLASEAALKMREAAGAWTESYPAMEYRHGPISVADAHSLVWIFGDPPAGLLDDVAATGATISTWAGDPLADLIRAQRLAVAVAESSGQDPDNPRNLSRSVILTS